MYLSSDTTLDSGDMLIAAPRAKRVRLAPGKSQLFSTNVILPSNTPLGTYHVIAKVVSGAGISDANAANDVAVAGQTVEVVDQPPAPQPQDDDSTDIVVVEYVVVPVPVPVGGYDPQGSGDDDTIVTMPDDGSADDGQPIEQPPQYDPDPQPDPTPPAYDPPSQPPVQDDPPPQYDPPTTQPEPDPQPPTTQPIIDDPPPVDTSYNSSGGDF